MWHDDWEAIQPHVTKDMHCRFDQIYACREKQRTRCLSMEAGQDLSRLQVEDFDMLQSLHI